MHIDVHEHAEEDLDALWKSDREAARAVLVALQQAEADPRIIDKLTQFGNSTVGVVRLNVKRWEKVRGRRGDLWRFRVLDTAATNYRVVYAYHWQTRQLCVLGVVHKERFNYELDSAIAQRILGDWRAL